MTNIRTLVVGDIHGCLEELEKLVATAGLTANDRLVAVGDLVGKGPDSEGVVNFFRSTKALAVMGNHDAALLEAYDAWQAFGNKALSDYRESTQKLVKKMSPDNMRWLRDLPLTFHIATNLLVVHGGLLPNVPLSLQVKEHLLNLRSINALGLGSRHIEDGVPWASLWRGPEHVFFGHDAIRGLQRHPFATGLDTGCVYGGSLTAIWADSLELVSVKAKKVYRDPGKLVSMRLRSDRPAS